MVRDRQFLTLLTWKCASRHNGVHFFDIATSKSVRRHNSVHFFDISTPKVVRSSSVLSILSWKCASCHNGQHFFMSHLASWLRTRRFSEPTFRPPEPPIIGKHSESRLSYLFARLHLLSSDLVSSDSSHLCFSTVHIVGSFTSKLSSIKIKDFKTFQSSPLSSALIDIILFSLLE